MDIHQLRSWIFELYEPLENRRRYVVFDAQRGNLLIDAPPFGERALRLLRGAGRAALLVVTGPGAVPDAARYREALGLQVAAHRDDAAAIEGGADVILGDDEALRPDVRVLRIGGTSVVLARKAGGVLFAADLDLASAPAQALLELEFSAILSAARPPVWSAGKDDVLRLQRLLPRPRKRFGVLFQAPWDRAYRGRLPQAMTANPLVPTASTSAPVAAMGPATLVVSRQSRDLIEGPRRPAWNQDAAAAAAPAAPATPAAAAATPRRARPRNFQEDWSAPASARPPTTVANAAREIQPAAAADCRPRPLGSGFREVPLEAIAAAPEIEARFGGIDLSPDGTEAAFAWDQSGAPEIFVAPLVGDRVFQLTAAGERSVSPRWSPDGRSLAFLRDRGGDERFALWLVDRDGKAERCLCPDASPAHAHGDPSWSPDGTRIACVTAADGGRSAITVVRADTGEAVPVTDGTHADTEPRWSPDGAQLLFTRSGENGSRLNLVSASGGAATPLDIAIPGASASMDAHWSPGGTQAAFTVVAGKRKRVAVARLAGGRVAGVERLGETPFDVTDPVWRPDQRGVICLHEQDASVMALRIFLASHAYAPVADRPGVHGSVAVGPDSETIVYTHESATAPRDVWMRRSRTVEPAAVTSSSPASVDVRTLVVPSLVTYAAGSRALLYVPHAEAVKRQGPPAAIVVPVPRLLAGFDRFAQVMANRGYVVLAVASSDAADVVAAADWLEREGLADGKRLGVHGGTAALAAAARAPQRFAAVSALGASVPAEQAARIGAPVLALFGANDRATDGTALLAALARAGTRCESTTYPGEGRVLRLVATRVDALRRAAEWFDRTLQA